MSGGGQDQLAAAAEPTKKKGEGTRSSLADCARQTSLALLPRQFQTELHGEAAAIELVRVQEGGRPCSDEGVGGAERVGVGHPIERSVVGGQPQAEVSVVEGIEGFGAELNTETLVDLGVLDQCEVPEVESVGSKRVAAEVRFSANQIGRRMPSRENFCLICRSGMD